MTDRIAITLQDGSLAVMQLETGFGRTADNAAVAATITKTGLAVTKWRRMGDADIAAYRTGNAIAKGALIDDGKAITIDPVRKAALDRARAAVRDPLAELDALKTQIAALAKGPP